MDTLQFSLFTYNLAALKISQFVLIHKIFLTKLSPNGEVSKAHKDAINFLKNNNTEVTVKVPYNDPDTSL